MESLLAAQSGDFSSFRESISSDLENGTIVDSSGYSIAHWSAYYDDIDIFQLQLQLFPLQIDARTNNGLAPIHIAALCNSKRILRHIIDHANGNIEAKTGYNETPLHLAASVGNEDVVRLLVAAGCDVESIDHWQRTAYQIAIVNGNTAVASYLGPLTKTPLVDEVPLSPKDTEYHEIMRCKIAKELQKKLAKKRSHAPFREPEVQNIYNISAPSPANPALLTPDMKPLALSQLIEYPGDPEHLECMLRSRKTDSGREINVNGKDMYGLTALHKICSWNKGDLLRILLAHLSTEEINTTSTKEGYSGLHFCVEYNAMQTLGVLLEDTRIDASVKDKQNCDYRELAVLKQLQL